MQRKLNRLSPYYVYTLNVDSAEDMAALQDLREKVATVNKVMKSINAKHRNQRVVVRGRKPIEKMAVHSLYTGKTKVLSYSYGGNIVGGLKNATLVDVYVYNQIF